MPVLQREAVPEMPSDDLQGLPRDAIRRLLRVWKLRRLLAVAVCLSAAVQLLRVPQVPRNGQRSGVDHLRGAR